jgi:hypothetical protein
MPRVFPSVVDQIQTLRLAWRQASPGAVIAGMTLAEFEAATTEPLTTRQEIERLNIQLNSARTKRDIADVAARDLLEVVVSGVKGTPEFGANSVLYGLLGYVRRSERKTGKVRKKRPSPPTLEVI